LEVAEATPNP